ncbi:Beta-phosphoglucomutase [Dactylella cylindrospora]|nr:Beta-phosphoglucomutase [Dactylella cylindrospora]
MPKITHLLFDCDNTLVLSEIIAFQVCAQLANEILSAHSIPKSFTGPELQSTYVGQNFRGMMTSLQKEYKFTMDPEEFESYVKKEEDVITEALSERAEPCEGVNEVLERLHRDGKYGLAVVSSSAKRRVLASITKVGQSEYFPTDDVFSAATSLPVPTSKPDPAIYLYACEKLGKRPAECVAIEDSKSGATSAKRAGIWVVGYVGPYEDEEERTKMEVILKEVGAVAVMRDWNEFEGILKQIEDI